MTAILKSRLLKVERELQPFGALITGYDPDHSEAASAELPALLERHSLVVLRGQSAPSDSQIESLLRPLGVLTSETEEGQMHFRTLAKASPSLVEDGSGKVGKRFNIANDPRGGPSKGINRGVSASELNWHNDQAHLPRLKTVSCLEAVVFEAGAGNTFFCNMYAAAESLEPALRRRLEGRTAQHDLSKYPADPDAPPRPQATRPALLPHPESGRVCLYVNPSFTSRIDGLPPEESTELLEGLFAHAYSPARVYEHHWQEGDIAVWDNVGVQHMRPKLDPTRRRVLRAFQGISQR